MAAIDVSRSEVTEQQSGAGDYRSYHFQLCACLILTAVVDSDGEIVDTCVSTHGEMDAEAVQDILGRIIERGRLVVPGQIEIFGADVSELYAAAWTSAHASGETDEECFDDARVL